jgi:hypothetical protein
MPQTLTVLSTLQCPHGGAVSITPSNQRVTAGGALVATSADECSISGCPFQLPTVPPTPSPCITVQWISHDTKVTAGSATLSQASQGLCISALGAPQGMVIVAATQVRVCSR